MQLRIIRGGAMSSDFWWGMFVIPAAALAVAGVLVAVMAVIWASAKWGGNEYKLWPKRWGQRESIVTVVATAKSVRYLWIPGWHIVICRTTMATRESRPEWQRRQRVQHAIGAAIRAEEEA
ncbi:hypothetical protein SEA_FLUDD_15 [Mycobacterium phage Fludd]|uniref:Uncharacterized protein n=11 Tax=Bixzunavirus TaxID=680114 RepID=A0A0N9EQ85_9CAUD|nr:hypothetical protein AWH68_gp016 [Mycobacterium phage Breeniome]AKG94582.1 hypothetical protein SEA_MOMO_15 [Mycobacterium phage Momo]ALF51115.1 hypothetical protein SEA_ERNIEJ_19 [Mycobacterium phage ErnieJ]ANT41554.1 hypothetical protein PBI_LITTLETON_16 [Mycobacterium phage Littleton]AOZ63373.1 hypothetical protein SEA_GABRIEL_16 [Mycobacterium phage Gabriel]AVI04621.1 hypothetical protein SEA_LIFESAVOR_16 [Mycobacterium phage LifeSavor]AZF95889.1 hypothetical protein SEA_MORIZZLED23_15